MLPDIGVLGPWTYLATEVAFGSVALALLVYAGDGALRRAGKTILALYPIAFVWDWYTLHVGVFAIELRTGVDLLGIPIEEHIFMVVVPALIVGMHETIHGSPADETAEEGVPSGKAAENGPAADEHPETTPDPARADGSGSDRTD